MSSQQKMVTGVFRDRVSADLAFDWLHSIGYNDSEVNVLMSDKTHKMYYAHDNKGQINAGSKAAEGMGIGGAIGTAVGAGIAAIAAIGSSLVIPGLGLGLVIAGPLAAAFAGGGAGAVTGGLVGALVGWGIPEDNATAYQEALKDGGVVMGVTARNSKDASNIKSKFEELKADDVLCYSC